MDLKFKGTKKNSSLKQYWFPGESSIDNTVENEAESERRLCVPDLSNMIDKWRDERGDIMKRKEQQKKKLQLKKDKYAERNKIAANEKHELKKKMEIALQSTLKNKDSSDLLLAQIDELESRISNDDAGYQLSDTREDMSENLPPKDQDYSFLLKMHMHEHAYDHEVLPFKKCHHSTLKCQETSEDPSLTTINCHSLKYFVYKKAIEEVFLRLKEQQEQDFCSSSRTSLEEKDIFKKSHYFLKDVYDEEMRTLNTKGISSQSIQFTFKAFPPFPSSIKELDFLSRNPLIIFREWCHFHLLSPISGKVTIKSLLNDYTNPKINNKTRLLSLCTLIQLYSEGQLLTKDCVEPEVEHSTCEDSKVPLEEQNNAMDQALHNTLKTTHGKLKLGTALALALMGKTNENKDTIASTLIVAMKGITTIERRIAALAMAHAGIFEHTVLHVLLEEWKAAQHTHTLYKYLAGLRWLSIHENSIIKSIAENLSTGHSHFRLYVCLTLPFIEGHLPKRVKDALNHMVHNANIYFLRLAAARVLECKGCGDCVHRYITSSLSSSNILQVLEVTQLSLMLSWVDPKIAGILVPCLHCEINYVKMVGLSIIEKLRINNPILVEAVSILAADRDEDLREAAFNTLRVLRVTASQIETLVVSTLVTENNENVLRAILKLIEVAGMKGKTIHKALRKVYKKEHNKEDQQFILDLLDITNVETDDASGMITSIKGEQDGLNNKNTVAQDACVSQILDIQEEKESNSKMRVDSEQKPKSILRSSQS